jgi:hypothetical protein
MFAEHEAQRLVRGRNPYLAFHGDGDRKLLKAKGAKIRRIYPRTKREQAEAKRRMT